MPEDDPRILIVDDDPDLVHLLRYSLSKEGFDSQGALSGEEGLAIALDFHPQVVITDLMMPGMDGTEFCRKLKSNPKLHPIYIIILTAKGEADSQINNLQLGADEYMVKPAVLRELRARIQVGLRWVESQTQLKKLATSDSLTGLPNRYLLDQVLEQAVAFARQEQSPLSLMLLDLDHFKDINDSYGHKVGDRALQKLADIIRRMVRSTDIPARYGGEEFVIVLPGIDQDFALRVARRLHATIATSLWPTVVKSFDGTNIGKRLDITRQLTASIGVATFPDLPVKSADELLQAADAATYHAKQTGRNRVSVYQQHVEGQDKAVATQIEDLPETKLAFELPQLYSAIERLNPTISPRDPALPGHLLEILQAQAVGWVKWEESGRLLHMGSAGALPESAQKISHFLPWENSPPPPDLLNHHYPVCTIKHLRLEALGRQLVMAVLVPAIDSEGHMIGGIWVAWDRMVSLSPPASFILSWLARLLGLELEIDRLKANTTPTG